MPGVPEPLTYEAAREWVAEVRWQFAKSVPEVPHWYTVRDWAPEWEDRFYGFGALIRQDGVMKAWQAPEGSALHGKPRTWRYLSLDGYEYWRGPWHIINRRRAEDGSGGSGGGSGATVQGHLFAPPVNPLWELRWTPPCLDYED